MGKYCLFWSLLFCCLLMGCSDDELIDLLLKLRWWDKSPEEVTELIPLLVSPDLDDVKNKLKTLLEENGSLS